MCMCQGSWGLSHAKDGPSSGAHIKITDPRAPRSERQGGKTQLTLATSVTSGSQSGMGHPCRHPGYKLNNPKTQQLNPGSQETANDTDGRVWKGTIDQNRRGQAENVTGTRTKFGETDALLKASCRKVLRIKKNQKNKTTKNKTKNKTKKTESPARWGHFFTSFAPRGQKNSHSELKNTEFPSTSNQGQEREPFQGVQVLLLSIGAHRRTYSTRANGFS